MDNLTSNAIKYAKGKRQKSSPSQADRHNIVIRFRDNGPGISPKNGKLVFKPFRRTKDATNSRKPGVGLGLALARDTARSWGLKLRFGTLGRRLSADDSQILNLPAGRPGNQPGSLPGPYGKTWFTCLSRTFL